MSTETSVLTEGEDEKALIMAIAGYPEAVRKAALTYDPSVIAALLYDIAKTFSHYYHDNQVLKAETRELVAARIGLSEMVLQTLKNAFSIIGIPFLSAM